ncbi:glutathione S-transferase family protein [Phenylobacterium montanum]|uniref:Glutathione S-transferase family protein n=1 Tax=Phenylobacterium montanum TaxID=2823693 RepID=A0A975G040_9CAUL|nr:glutathione S-transferase family protein [Caulobacter sp. S6]QUD87506.1 glutathione S-transferase family protein [Caulobacter sp. S6]
MIRVYGGWPSRSMRVQWLLEELGVAYELRAVDLRRRMEDAEFMAVNPGGFLPAMVDGDVHMVESLAVMEYLLERYGPGGLVPATGAPERPAYLQFLHLGEAGMASFVNILVASRFAAPEGEKDNFGARTAVQMFTGRLKLVEQRLGEAPFMAGAEFSAADISVCYALEFGARLGLQDRYAEAVTAYMARLAERNGYKRMLERWRPPA